MAFSWRDLVPDFIEDAFGGIKNAVNRPYEEKARGLEHMQGLLGNLKKERQDRIESVYGRANSQFDDTRKAMAAMYGDPSQWRL